MAHQVPLSQARMLERVAISFSRGSSRPWDQTHISCVGRRILYHWATREAYGWVHVLLRLSKPTEQTPPRVNLKCKAQFGVRMICQLQDSQLKHTYHPGVRCWEQGMCEGGAGRDRGSVLQAYFSMNLKLLWNTVHLKKKNQCSRGLGNVGTFE